MEVCSEDTMEERMRRDEAIEQWQDAQWERSCSCHIAPPCSFCVDGYSLELDEFLKLYWEPEHGGQEVEVIEDFESDYDRAMRGI